MHGVTLIYPWFSLSLSQVVGRCVLYGYTESSSEAEYGWVWFPGSHNHCNYVMGISSMFCIVYSAGEYSSLTRDNREFINRQKPQPKTLDLVPGTNHPSRCTSYKKQSTPLPPMVQNVLDFMQFFGNFDKIVCWRPLEGQRPSYRESWIRPWEEYSLLTGWQIVLQWMSGVDQNFLSKVRLKMFL